MHGWNDGDPGATWHDYNKDSTDTHVTFYQGCTHEFTARIRKENFGPDDTIATEYINCGSYDDAVRAGDIGAEDYHFDIQDIRGFGTCGKFECPTPNTSGNYREYW